MTETLELLETEDGPTSSNPLYHHFCGLCYPGEIQPDVAYCGYVFTQGPESAIWDTPEEDSCVVCIDLSDLHYEKEHPAEWLDYLNNS